MTRTLFLGFVFATGAVVACAGRRGPGVTAPGLAESARGPDAAALALSDEYVAAVYARFPEWGTYIGYPGTNPAAITDNRPEALAAWHAREDVFLARVRAIRLITPDTAGWVARGIALETLEASVASRACNYELWSASSFDGWQGDSAVLAALQPVGTPERRRAAAARLAALPGYVDQEIANLREGVRIGYTASRANVERAVGELDALLATPPERWPHLSPADRDPAPGFRAELEQTVRERLLPGTRRYRDYLAGEYLAHAHAAPGVSALPEGAACYRAAIRSGTTLALGPEELHALGEARLQAIRAEMQTIAERSFGTPDVTALLARLGSDPAHGFHSGEELVARARSAVERAERAMPRVVTRVPRARVEVKPLPDAQARSGGTARYSPTGGAGGGVYWVNAWDPEHKPRFDAETTAFHETWPGHHLQIAIALESEDRPAASRYLLCNAYAEGWALYAERLADELGLFSSEEERLGLLASESFRAARLVVDTGIHALGWSRERAIDQMVAATGWPRELLAAEVDRYGASPGQALGYMVGALEIHRLRQEAARALGARFDVRAFHDLVLSDPNVSLAMLGEKVARWTEAQRGGR
jgi:uncharacterized protein (DUF885 family)